MSSFLVGFHTTPGQRHSQPTPTSLGHGIIDCSGVACHMHFWENDQGLFRVTGMPRTPNKSQHRMLILGRERKKNLPPLLQGFELTAFRSRVLRSANNYSRLPVLTDVLKARVYITDSKRCPRLVHVHGTLAVEKKSNTYVCFSY